MSIFLLRIKAPNRTVWCASETLETLNLGEAVKIADKLALACKRTAAVHHDATRHWVVEVISEFGELFHAAPVARI